MGHVDEHTHTQSSASSLPSSPSIAVPHDSYAALRYRDFRLLALGNFVATLGEQMLNVAVGWELYVRTGSALALGIVGLVQVLPVILLSLPAGHFADRFDRKRIVLITQLLLAVVSLGLTLLSFARGPVPLIYACLLFIGIATAFNTPASTSLVPQIVPSEFFANAATWTSSSWQLSAVVGPALGGFVIALGQSATPVYILDALANLIFICLLLLIHSQQVIFPREATTPRSLLAGLSFVRRTQIILAVITLDLFAVLLGGATTLLPIFALSILHVGATGLGLLRAAPSIGAVLMALTLAHLPPLKKAGRTMLWAVAGFGAATVIFGLSHTFVLSLLTLALLGALDNISVVIRSTLMLTRTPDEMRGRVSAVNGVFVSMSNELGGFESGVAAALLGPVVAVVGGGVGTILVVVLVAFIWPEVRRLGRLTDD